MSESSLTWTFDVRCSTFISYLIVTTKVNMFVLALKLSSALLPVKVKSKRSLYRKMTGYLHMADIAELGGLFIADISPFWAARRKGTTGLILSVVAPVQFR